MIKTNDGSYTLYSETFNQHYHSVKDGALNESLYKHVIPAITFHKDKKELNILDMCFGLGYNTLATLYYLKKHNLDIKINIYSPEFNLELLESLKHFQYPDELISFKYIIDEISSNLIYEDLNTYIEVFNGDAREYIKTLPKNIDIVYQDAFSSDVNKSLWTQEYFKDISQLLTKDSLITTYSIATPIRLGMYENDLFIYEYYTQLKDRSTLAFKTKQILSNQHHIKYIDMELKKQRNLTAKSLRD